MSFPVLSVPHFDITSMGNAYTYKSVNLLSKRNFISIQKITRSFVEIFYESLCIFSTNQESCRSHQKVINEKKNESFLFNEGVGAGERLLTAKTRKFKIDFPFFFLFLSNARESSAVRHTDDSSPPLLVILFNNTVKK